VGAVAAIIAIGIRYSLPLEPIQIPTLTVVVALALVTTFVGVIAGITTALIGGLLAWYLFFNDPFSWSLADGAWIPALAYAVIATVILTTSYLYRSSEQARHERDLAILRSEAETANLFAREMAHRLKNALTIVQSIAFQTIGVETAEAGKFAGRLKALADANELLTEHVEMPTAKVTQVIEAAVKPFGGIGSRIRIDSVDAAIPAQQVVSLALAIHELATNASKYGALSSPDGWVEVRGEDVGDRLLITWAEHDGPPVITPESQGFGTRLLRRAGMNAKLDFAPDGVRCSIRMHKAA
jgi:two-component sensor histidine kinase